MTSKPDLTTPQTSPAADWYDDGVEKVAPVGFIALLSKKQLENALKYRGDENHGDPTYKRK